MPLPEAPKSRNTLRSGRTFGQIALSLNRIVFAVLAIVIVILAAGTIWFYKTHSASLDEVAQAPANVIESSDESRTLSITLVKKLDAYQDVLMSRQLAETGNTKSIDAAVDYAQQAVDLDPQYADAHLALARSLVLLIDAGAATDSQAGARIRDAINTAMALEPENGSAHSILGFYQFVTGKPGFESSFESAMRLEPANAKILYTYGYTLQRSGKPQSALSLLLKASELDPHSKNILYALGRTYSALDEYEKARRMFARVREIDPASPLGYGSVSATYFHQGQLDKAVFWLRKALDISPQDSRFAGFIVFSYDSLEDYTAAGEWTDWLEQWVTKQAQPIAMQAKHHYLVGDFESAVQYSNIALRLQLADSWGSDAIFMRIKRDEALANGKPDAGIRVFSLRHPGLLEEPADITPENVMQAVDLAQLLKMAGRSQEAQSLLQEVITFLKRDSLSSGLEHFWLAPARAEALALLGHERAALAELRRVIDKGWRIGWRWETVLNYNFNGIRNTPEFQAMVDELTADMADQRLRAQTMADEGEIPPPPQSAVDRIEGFL